MRRYRTRQDAIETDGLVARIVEPVSALDSGKLRSADERLPELGRAPHEPVVPGKGTGNAFLCGERGHEFPRLLLW